MADLFSRRLSESGGSFSVDDSLLTFPGLPGSAAFIPFIIQNLGLQYGQTISRLYGLNLSKVFLVAGRAQGNAAMQQVLAPQGDLKTFYETYGNVCNARQNVMSLALRSGCTAQTISNQRFTCGTCVATQLAVNATSETGVVNNSTQISFESLEYDED